MASAQLLDEHYESAYRSVKYYQSDLAESALECMVCQQLPYDPVKCYQCDRLVCKKELMKLGSSQGGTIKQDQYGRYTGVKCPQCFSAEGDQDRHVSTEFVKLARLERKALMNVRVFGCCMEDCAKKIVPNWRLSDFLTHIDKECKHIIRGCPLEGCEEAFILKNSGDHFRECPKAYIKCMRCSKITLRSQIEEDKLCNPACLNLKKRSLIPKRPTSVMKSIRQVQQQTSQLSVSKQYQTQSPETKDTKSTSLSPTRLPASNSFNKTVTKAFVLNLAPTQLSSQDLSAKHQIVHAQSMTPAKISLNFEGFEQASADHLKLPPIIQTPKLPPKFIQSIPDPTNPESAPLKVYCSTEPSCGLTHLHYDQESEFKINYETLVANIKRKRVKMGKKVPLMTDQYSKESLQFIVKHQRSGLVYAGDMDNLQVVIIDQSKKDEEQQGHSVVKVEAKPYCGYLACNESLLIVGLAGGQVKVYSLANPLFPQLVRTIQLKSIITTMMPLTEHLALIGEYGGILTVCDVYSGRILCSYETGQEWIRDMTLTNELGELAVVTSKGLFIMHYEHDQESLKIKHHFLRSLDLLSCAYLKEKELLLGRDGDSTLFVYEYRFQQELSRHQLPTGDRFPYRITPLEHRPAHTTDKISTKIPGECSYFLVQDMQGLSLICTDKQNQYGAKHGNSTLLRELPGNWNRGLFVERNHNKVVIHGNLRDYDGVKRWYVQLEIMH
ncbi:hypothetical protein FGO68_gene2868 [Halteria grandinella]|uniref:Uncharacterized protein n=1 Tax=Halteria grandinella TaxID=5974 RepID=A0A8J8NZL7_HALGN|nr:hypothetical protein FGO68_gene2868 [Halteria grandinella]